MEGLFLYLQWLQRHDFGVSAYMIPTGLERRSFACYVHALHVD